MTQSGVAKNTFFLVTLYNFQKRGRAIANNDRIYAQTVAWVGNRHFSPFV